MAGTDKPQGEASTSAAKVAQDANKGEEDAKKTLPQLGALEEDDEFEEVSSSDSRISWLYTSTRSTTADNSVSCLF